MLLGLGQAPADALPFGSQYLFQPLLQVIHHRIHVVLLQLLAPLVLESFHQLPQAGQLHTFPILHPLPEQLAQGLHHVALLQQLIG